MANNKIRFGSFELDAKAGELRRDGRRMRLQEKPLKMLLALVEQAGEVVSRDELRARLWPAKVVVDFDNGLNNAANKLRAVLGDSANAPRYIETVGRRGYRFIGALDSGDAVAPVPAASPADEIVPATASAREAPWAIVRVGAAVAVALVLAAVAALALRGREDVFSGPPRIEALAVLPLANLSSDPEQEYFSDGMTDALIAELASIGSLRIISRQSVMRYKSSDAPMPTIGQELNVDGVIEGTVLKSADRVRITVQLIHAPTDRHVWSAQYEEPLGDVLALQAQIARTVARELRASLTPEESARLAHTSDVDPEAYDLYLRGRHFFVQRTNASMHRALEYFERALAIEPDFAPALAAMAEAYGPLGYLGYMPPDQATPKMRAYALRALELDPESVEGWTALGAWAAFHDWRLAEAEQHFQRALRLSTNYSTTYGWYGQYLENIGRQQENLAARQRAFELDPLWVGTGSALGQALFFNGRAEEGIAVLERTIELDPANTLPWTYLGFVYSSMGRFEAAIEAYTHAGDDGGLGYSYALAGRREEALACLRRLEQSAREAYVAPRRFALVHMGLGDVPAALAALEQSYELRDPGLSGLGVDPRFAPLAQEPRFVAILQKMQLR
jgi:TolB-like protein/DNA-binding winged helix-turn-helix (wHTH) protein/Flp pilus assembly protein TadD